MDARGFLEKYQVTDIEKDPLPIKVLRNAITKEEIPCQAMHWAFEYLDQRSCPLPLINHINEKLFHDVREADFSQCMEALDDSVDSGNDAAVRYEPLKLMRAVVKILDEICLKEKEDFQDSVDGMVESPDMMPHVYAVSYNNIKNTRRFMEDRMAILPSMDRIFKLPNPMSYFAVFDGHNGSEAAAYGAAQLHHFITESMEQFSDPISSILDAFERLDAVFVQKCSSGKVKSGSTAVVSLIMPDKLYVAWVGDSQAVLVKRDEVNNLVTPHKPERPDEIERIRSLGGEVFQMNGTYRVNGNLAVSRAIGDADDKSFIVCNPDIKMLELDGSEEFLILACDGLWDEISPEAAAHILRHQVVNDASNISGISQKLIQQAKHHGSTDNISVIVVFLEAVESIKNRYEAVLGGELDLSAFKRASEPIEQIPIAKQIENSVEGNLGLVMELNGHGKEPEQIVDFLSFGSSRESGAQLIGDDGNHSGDEILNKEVEEVSDGESDDEWQFNKPSDPHAQITNNGILETAFAQVDEVTSLVNPVAASNSFENPFGLVGASGVESPTGEQEIKLTSHEQPVENPGDSFNPFSSGQDESFEGHLTIVSEPIIPSTTATGSDLQDLIFSQTTTGDASSAVEEVPFSADPITANGLSDNPFSMVGSSGVESSIGDQQDLEKNLSIPKQEQAESFNPFSSEQSHVVEEPLIGMSAAGGANNLYAAVDLQGVDSVSTIIPPMGTNAFENTLSVGDFVTENPFGEAVGDALPPLESGLPPNLLDEPASDTPAESINPFGEAGEDALNFMQSADVDDKVRTRSDFPDVNFNTSSMEILLPPLSGSSAVSEVESTAGEGILGDAAGNISSETGKEAANSFSSQKDDVLEENLNILAPTPDEKVEVVPQPRAEVLVDEPLGENILAPLISEAAVPASSSIINAAPVDLLGSTPVEPLVGKKEIVHEASPVSEFAAPVPPVKEPEEAAIPPKESESKVKSPSKEKASKTPETKKRTSISSVPPTKKTPAKPGVESPTRTGLVNGKSAIESPTKTGVSPSKTAAGAKGLSPKSGSQKPLLPAVPKTRAVGATAGAAAKTTTYRAPIATTTSRPAVPKAQKDGDNKLAAKPSTNASGTATRTRPTTASAATTTTARPAPGAKPITSPKKVATTTATGTAPRVPAPRPADSARTPHMPLTIPSSGAQLPKPKPRPTPALSSRTTSAETKTGSDSKRLAGPKSATSTIGASKPTTMRPPMSRPLPTSARTTAPSKPAAPASALGPKSAPSRPGLAAKDKAGPTTTTTSRALPRVGAPARTASAAGPKKPDSANKTKKPAVSSAKAEPPTAKKVTKPPPTESKSGKIDLIDIEQQNGNAPQEPVEGVKENAMNVLNGINGEVHEDAETEKQDPVKENGVHDEAPEAQVVAVADLLG